MGGDDLSANSKEAKDAGAGVRHGHATATAFEVPQRDTVNSSATQAAQVDPIDLLTLIPENFQEIPYLT